jgi:hypothetical protein
VQILNGLAVALVEGGDARAGPTFNLDAVGTYFNNNTNSISSVPREELGSWLDSWSDVGFNRLDC